jgi:MGT family glycosyltransferase
MSLEGLMAAGRVGGARGYDELEWALRLFTSGLTRLTRELVEHLRHERPDLVVADFAYFGAWLAAELVGVPHAAVFHSGLPFPSDDGAVFGSALGEDVAAARARLSGLVALVDGRVAATRRALGLAAHAPALLTRPYARRLNVLTTFEAMEPPRTQLGALAEGPVLYAGPCLGERAAASGALPALEGAKPVVFVSLGTVFNDQPRLYRVLLDGVHRAGARAVVAAGASLSAVRAVAERDDVVERFLPQVELLARVGAFITHGGNNSTNEALRAGTPVVVVPFGAEQRSNALRVQQLGVGSSLDAARLEPGDVARAVEAALSAERQARSKALAARLPQGDGTARVVDALLGLPL